MAKAAANLDELENDAADLVEETQDTVVNLIQEQPITAVLVALVAGVLLGKLVF